MQVTKDTFLKALSERLAVVNPARTMVLDGAPRPAVLALENETPVPADTELETFLLTWKDVGMAMPEGTLMYMDCELSYGSLGTDAMLHTDRGRILTAMDCELLQICEQRRVSKCDYAQTPPRPLGTNVFWTMPVIESGSEVNGILHRTATMRLFFFPEVG
jgi:hypothetical protein